MSADLLWCVAIPVVVAALSDTLLYRALWGPRKRT